MATLKKADTEAIQSQDYQSARRTPTIKYRGYTSQGHRKGRGRATIERADTMAIQFKGTSDERNRATVKRGDTDAIQKSRVPQSKGKAHHKIQRLYKSGASQREGKGNNKESGYGGYTNQGYLGWEE